MEWLLGLLRDANDAERDGLDASDDERGYPPAEMLLKEEAEDTPDPEDNEVDETAIASLLVCGGEEEGVSHEAGVRRCNCRRVDLAHADAGRL